MGLGTAAQGQSNLGQASLAIAGTTLTVSPESQTVPFDTPTIVGTHLAGFDPAAGTLPADLRVVGDFSGPEIDGVLTLETVPNEPFRIPRLSLAGEYQLDDIRLVQGGELLAYAEPRSAAIRVTQILVTRVTSRAMTLDEIRSHGIVVDGTSVRAFNFTFGFGVEGDTFDYNVPVVYVYPRDRSGPPAVEVLTGGASQRFQPPQLAPFTLQLMPRDGPQQHGCADPGGCDEEQAPPLPGVILFPVDLNLLHQFFSVVLLATNGAPEGDPLVIRDLTAKIHLPSGLAPARTEPPTVLGSPVPLRVPGPDGELGTADDLTFLVAQATANAEFLVEGLREGTHVVDFDLEGLLEGLPTGIRRISGKARGAVVVRDPTLGITISHPDVVRADEEYTMQLAVTNTGITPANLVHLTLPPSQLSGVVVVGDNRQTIESILPGESEVVEFRLRPLITGRVVASYVRADSHVSPSFDLHVGVGEAGIPLSPTEIVLPTEVDSLPPVLKRQALGLVGLGFSLASAPSALLGELPRLARREVDQRVFELAQAGRYVSLGADLFDASAELACEWLGARDHDWDWDTMRRITRRGALVGDALGDVFAEEARASTARDVFERFARATADIALVSEVATGGAGSYLEISSRTSGKRVFAPGTSAERVRDLPFADLYDLGEGEMALLGWPEEGGYRVTLRRRAPGVSDLDVLAPGASSPLREWRWTGIGLSENGRAVVDFDLGGAAPVLALDADGDGVFEDQIPGSPVDLAPRPFAVVAAVQNSQVDKTGHVVDVLLSADVDWQSLAPRNPAHFQIDGKVSDGGFSALGTGAFEGLRAGRIVRVVFDNPLSPYATHELTVDGVRSVLGAEIDGESVAVRTTVSMPGTMVQGRVIGADGLPVPFARVELAEVDLSNLDSLEDPCIQHVTAAVRADANGQFFFDYVRQTECGGVFELRGFEPASGHVGRAFGRVRFIGQTVSLDIVLLGRGLIRGRVTYDDGSVPRRLRVVAANPAFLEARRALLDDQGNYEVGDLPVGPITISAQDGEGNAVAASVEIPTAGSTVLRDLVIPRRPPRPSGSVGGTVLSPDGVTPVYNAYLALYVGQTLVDVRRSDVAGDFDFGSVPAGAAEIEAFEGETGRSGARVFFDVAPDQASRVTILLRDERGVVEGHVYRQELAGAVPLAGAVVYVSGQPFHTTTDAQGYYRLDGVIAGQTRVVAADLERQLTTWGAVNLVGDDFDVVRDLYFALDSGQGGIQGEVLDVAGLPVPGAVVHIATSDVTWSRETIADGQGRFAFGDLSVGHYEVHAIKGADGGKVGVDIDVPGQAPFVTIRFRHGTIRGTVRAEQPEGEPVGVVAVVRYRTTVVRFGLVGLDTTSHDLITDSDGSFELPEALAGPYRLEVFNAFYGSQSIQGEIVTNGQVDDHQVLFRLAGAVEGVVYDYDGVTPVAGAVVALDHPSFASYQVSTDDLGQFRFAGLPPDPAIRFGIRAHAEQGVIQRDARIWAVLAGNGQTLSVSLTLPIQGSVSGRVESDSGEAVAGAAVHLRGALYPFQSMAAQSDADGNFQFANVQAGSVVVSALDLAGLGGKATATVDVEGEQEQVLIRLQPVGSIHGRVTSPVDGSPVSSAQVQLHRGGLFDSATSDGGGEFAFEALPLGAYEIRAFDARTGRSGKSGGQTISYPGQVLEVTVVLEARGSVHGHLYDPAGHVPVVGATVQLDSQGLIPFTTYCSTDAEGAFAFDGVPQGTFRLRTREPGGFRTASGAGEIVREGDEVAIDLVLQESGSAAGRILEPVPDSEQLFGHPTTVAVYQDSRFVGGSVDNPYHVGGILAGRGFTVQASQVGGAHRGSATGLVSTEGQEAHVDVRMWPIGAVRVSVLGAGDVAVAGAAVHLTSHGPYGTQLFDANTGADGSVVFPQVGAGTVSAFAVDPATQLRGSASGSLAVDGAELPVSVRLEPSQELEGRVVEADGVTAAQGAVEVVQVAGRTYYAICASDGRFDFPALPLGGFSIDIVENLGPGEWHGSGVLSSASPSLDLGTIRLDDRDPAVESVLPVEGAVAVPLATAITVTFSEPVASSRAQASWVELRKLGSATVVATARLWTNGDRTLVVTPTQPLQSFTSYQVKVNTGVVDLAGRHLALPVLSSFTTVDSQPPVVISTIPASSALNVPVDVQLHVAFSEPVDLESLSGTALSLFDVDSGAGVTTTFTLQPQGREALITPVADLVADHVHRLTVQGVRDLSGNPMAQPFVLTFETRDVTPPAVGAIDPAAGTSVTSGDSLTVSAAVTDNQGMGTVTFRWLGLTTTLTSPTIGSSYRWSLVVPPVLAPTDAELEIEAVDVAGNLAHAAVPLHVEPLLDPDSPRVEVLCPSAGAILVPGTRLSVLADASDDQGLLKVEFFLGTSTIPVASLTAPPFRYLVTAPSTAQEGDSILVRVVATDYGLKSTEASVAIGIVQGAVITGSRSITAADTSFDGQSVAIAAGTVTIDGSHRFRDLAVLAGASVTHRDTTPAAEYRLDLHLDRDLFVACEGSVEVSGLGYRGGGKTGGRAYGFGNLQTEGANFGVAASHGGRGGGYDGSSRTYGSLFDPGEPGGGSGGNGAQAGSDGGGVIRIDVGRYAVVDGAMRANGATNLAPGAAGGSVRLDAQDISGRGTIEADGGPGGGGGRIALYGQSIADDLVARVHAYGGARSGGGATSRLQGAAGTVFLRRNGEARGELRIDNRDLASEQWTELLSIGSGVVDSASADSVTDLEADFRFSLAGLDVLFDGDDSDSWTVLGNAPHGQSLQLAVEGHPHPATVGSVYSGRLVLDRLTVRGSARAFVEDRVSTSESATVESGSRWIPEYQPPALTLADVEVLEGTGESTVIHLTARLSRAADEEARFHFATVGGTATAGVDFTPAEATAVIPTGSTEFGWNVVVAGDGLAEPDETLDVVFDSAVGVRLPATPAVITLLDDDAGHCSGPELLANGGAEEPVVGGSIPGWTRELGSTWTEASGGAAEGSRYFYAGAVSLGHLTQDVDVSFLAEAIDASRARLAFSSLVRSFDQPDPDAASLELEFRDATNSVVLAVAASGEVASVSEWRRIGMVAAPPPGTRWLRARLIARRVASGTTSNDANFDAVSLRPLDEPIVDMEGAAAPEGTGGASGLSFPIRLWCGPQSEVRVDVTTASAGAVSGVDFAPFAATVIFPEGASEESIEVALVTDAIDEDDENLRLVASSPIGATLRFGSVLGVIVDDDTTTIAISDLASLEGTAGVPSTFSVPVGLSLPSSRPIAVQFATVAGTATSPADFADASGTVSFAPGETAKVVLVSVAADALDEHDENLSVLLSNPSGAPIADGEAQVSILDDDDNLLTVSDAQVAEGTGTNPSLAFQIHLSSPALEDVSVSYQTEAISADSGSDYLPASGTATLPAGQTSLVVSVEVVADSAVEPTESLRLVVTEAPGATLEDPIGLGTIVDDDLTGAIADSTAVEGNSGFSTMAFAVALNAPAPQPVSVEFATVALPPTRGAATPGSDYTSTSGTLTFAAGEQSRPVLVPIRGDATDEPREHFLVRLSNPQGLSLTDSEADGGIVDDEPPTVTTILPPNNTLVDGGSPLTISAIVTDAAGVASVTFTLDGVDFADSAAPYAWDTVAPSPANLTTYTIGLRAVDGEGNVRLASSQLRVRPPQIPPALDPAKVHFQSGFFGLSIVGEAGAVSDPTDPPITVESRNLATDEVFAAIVAPDGSFTLPSFGSAGESFELRAHDAIGLESATVGLGPLVGDEGRVAASAWFVGPYNRDGDGPITALPLVAASDGLLAGCNCYDQSQQPEHFDGLLDLQLFDISTPLSPSLAGELQLHYGDDPPDLCSLANESCSLTCDTEVGFSSCYDPCAAACDPEDQACFDACYESCGGARADACWSDCFDGRSACDASQSCEDGASACRASCTLGGDDPACVAGCQAFSDACAAGIHGAFYLPYAFLGFDIESGVVAIVQGPYVRIVDARDPSTPFLDDARQSLRLLSSGRLAGVQVRDGYAYALEASSPNRLFVLDVRDPRNPVVLASSPLGLGTVKDFRVEGGELHAVTADGGLGTYHRLTLGVPGESVRWATSSTFGVADRVAGLTPIDGVAAFTATGHLPHLLTFHADQESGSSVHSSPFFADCDPGGTAPVGDLFAISCGGAQVAVGSLDTSLAGHGFALQSTEEAPFGNVTRLLVDDGLLWTFPSGVGYPSAALRPWLERRRITIERTAGGALATGSPGAAIGAVALRAAGAMGLVEVPVAPDGSFSAPLAGAGVGEALRLQAADAEGHGGSSISLRVPAGSQGGFLSLSAWGGASRVARQSDLVAAVAAEVDGGGLSHVALGSVAGGALVALSEVATAGPVRDAVVANGALYLAGTALLVFDLADAANPVPQAPVDLFGGNPVLALAFDGTRLWALGAVGPDQQLLPVDLTTPLAPVAAAADAIPIVAAGQPRLFVVGSSLYRLGDGRIDRWSISTVGPPASAASGTFVGLGLRDLEVVDGEIEVASAGEGPRGLVEAGGALSLGAAPSRPTPVAGLFSLSDSEGSHLWSAVGLAGAEESGADRRFSAACFLRDALASPSDLLLLTGCGVELEVQP
ncbi:MAG: carboxypeptidase regulatory-like domain-containing protein [Thermoanaerobaculia bacterium]